MIFKGYYNYIYKMNILPSDLINIIYEYSNPYKEYYDKVIHNIRNISVTNELKLTINQAYVTKYSYEDSLFSYDYNGDETDMRTIFFHIRINRWSINRDFHWKKGKCIANDKRIKKDVLKLKKEGKCIDEILLRLKRVYKGLMYNEVRYYY